MYINMYSHSVKVENHGLRDWLTNTTLSTGSTKRRSPTANCLHQLVIRSAVACAGRASTYSVLNCRSKRSSRVSSQISAIMQPRKVLMPFTTRMAARIKHYTVKHPIEAPEDTPWVPCFVCAPIQRNRSGQLDRLDGLQQIGHLISHCPVFMRNTPTERAEYIRDASICWKCWQPAFKNGVKVHTANECPIRRLCMVCRGNHHTLLHGAGFVTHKPDIGRIQWEDFRTMKAKSDAAFKKLLEEPWE